MSKRSNVIIGSTLILLGSFGAIATVYRPEPKSSIKFSNEYYIGVNNLEEVILVGDFDNDRDEDRVVIHPSDSYQHKKINNQVDKEYFSGIKIKLYENQGDNTYR